MIYITLNVINTCLYRGIVSLR